MSNNFKKVLIRTDSSSDIGTGHIMRDLVLANQFLDSTVIFSTQSLSGNINHKVKESGYDLKILKSMDIEELDGQVKELGVDLLIFDHYGVSYDYEKQMKLKNPSLTILVVDDTYERHYCDILLNHNVYAHEERYTNLVPGHCELRCGVNYMLLRDEFKVEKERGRQNKNNQDNLIVFVAIGGTDHSNINIKILNVLRECKNIHVHIVTTTANKHINDLLEYVDNNDNVELYINTDNVASLMNESDFAIVTPSVTINEIYFLGVPFIAIETADNQRYMTKYLKSEGYSVLSSFDALTLLEECKKMFELFNRY